MRLTISAALAALTAVVAGMYALYGVMHANVNCDAEFEWCVDPCTREHCGRACRVTRDRCASERADGYFVTSIALGLLFFNAVAIVLTYSRGGEGGSYAQPMSSFDTAV